MGSLFFRIIIFMLFLGLAGFIVGHELSAVLRIKQADAQIRKAKENGDVLGFGEQHRILLAVASHTWIPGLDQLVRDEQDEGYVTLFTCTRSTENPFADLAGRGDTIYYQDLDEANGNLFNCK